MSWISFFLGLILGLWAMNVVYGWTVGSSSANRVFWYGVCTVGSSLLTVFCLRHFGV